MSDSSCQFCKKHFDQEQENQNILVRCLKCQQGACKFCLIKDYQIPQDPRSCDQNDVALRSILTLLDIKYEQGNLKEIP